MGARKKSKPLAQSPGDPAQQDELTASERALFEAFFASKPGQPLADDPEIQSFIKEHPNNKSVVTFLQWVRRRKPSK